MGIKQTVWIRRVHILNLKPSLALKFEQKCKNQLSGRQVRKGIIQSLGFYKGIYKRSFTQLFFNFSSINVSIVEVLRLFCWYNSDLLFMASYVKIELSSNVISWQMLHGIDCACICVIKRTFSTSNGNMTSKYILELFVKKQFKDFQTILTIPDSNQQVLKVF